MSDTKTKIQDLKSDKSSEKSKNSAGNFYIFKWSGPKAGGGSESLYFFHSLKKTFQIFGFWSKENPTNSCFILHSSQLPNFFALKKPIHSKRIVLRTKEKIKRSNKMFYSVRKRNQYIPSSNSCLAVSSHQWQ